MLGDDLCQPSDHVQALLCLVRASAVHAPTHGSPLHAHLCDFLIRNIQLRHRWESAEVRGAQMGECGGQGGTVHRKRFRRRDMIVSSARMCRVPSSASYAERGGGGMGSQNMQHGGCRSPCVWRIVVFEGPGG